MANQNAAGQGIEDLYRSVMNDVINQVKEAFLDENIDVDVLYQLKKMWEDKVNQSGAVDLTPKSIPAPTIRPPVRTNVGQRGMVMSQPGPSAGPSTVVIQRPAATHQPYQQLVQNVQNPQQVQYVQATSVSAPGQGPSLIQMPANAFRVVSQQGSFMPSQAPNLVLMPGGQIMQIVPANNGAASNIIQAPLRPQMQAPTKSDPHGMNYINQLDGASRMPDDDGESKSKTSTVMPTMVKKLIKNHRPTSDNPRGKVRKIPQLDGGPGMDDSSSEDELDDEEDDPLRRIADRIGNDGDAEEEEKVDEEDPLNSGDDQSDDEDLETLFDSSNIVVCQFEKVHRARTKWKFALKDGIMNINGKDYCFQKCTGEAEW